MSTSSKNIKIKFTTVSRINSRIIEMIACLWIILTLSNVAMSQPNFYTHGRYGKREESVHTSIDPSTFFSGSRYGRDDPGVKDNANRKSVELLPRVDRFFLGSRYGKRADTNISSDKRFPSLKNIEAALKYYDHIRRVNQKSIGNNLKKVALQDADQYELNSLLTPTKIMDFPNLKTFRIK